MKYLKFKNLFDFEKKSVFLVNFLMIFLVILTFLFKIKIEYFFYFNIIFTFIVSFLYFKKSRKLAKTIIITNMFIFFYFLYGNISSFLTAILGSDAYVFILLYNVLIAYIFLAFSDFNKTFIGNFRKMNLKLTFLLILLSLVFGLLFALVKEPIPSMFINIANANGFYTGILFLALSSFVVAFSEQIIFSGFLFNTYKKLTTKFDAMIQTSTLFVMFHLLRFQILVNIFHINFQGFYLITISIYYIFLFVFLMTCLYFYSIKNSKYEGNFFYPVIIHFITDFSLFFFTMINI